MACFGNGLFFEFIEQRSGYRGFGAANAPFRLAAQRRISKIKQFLTQIECIDFSIMCLQTATEQKQNLII